MAIERFTLTTHAENRRTRRLLNRAELERTIRDGHGARRINRGEADRRIYGLLADGHLMGFEIWGASKILPAEMIAALPLASKPKASAA